MADTYKSRANNSFVDNQIFRDVVYSEPLSADGNTTIRVNYVPVNFKIEFHMSDPLDLGAQITVTKSGGTYDPDGPDYYAFDTNGSFYLEVSSTGYNYWINEGDYTYLGSDGVTEKVIIGWTIDGTPRTIGAQVPYSWTPTPTAHGSVAIAKPIWADPADTVMLYYHSYCKRRDLCRAIQRE